MTAAAAPSHTAQPWPARIENPDAPGRAVVICEHASNRFPEAFGTLGLTASQRRAHIAWDPGALGLARELARALDSPLVSAPLSRLIHDCNRPPDAAGAMAARSEVHDIPGNAALSAAARLERVDAVYRPFHDGLRALILRRMTLGLAPVLVTIHSFAPVFHGKPRSVQFGVIHDADRRLADAVMVAAKALSLETRLNQPYSAAEGVTHTLALQATPYGLPNVMLEVRNDLIATPDAENQIATLLAPVLAEAIAALTPQSGTAAARTG